VQRLIAAIGLGIAISATPACARDAPTPQREAISRVMDNADLLDAATEQALTSKSEALEKLTSDQLVIVTLPGLRGQSIESVGLALGRRWGVGQKGLDNGVLLLVAPNERQVRIEVGYGLEALLTDERAAAIVREQVGLFRNGKNAEAIVLGVDRIDALLRSNAQRPQYRRPHMKKAA
jgi:uncharacterized protein